MQESSLRHDYACNFTLPNFGLKSDGILGKERKTPARHCISPASTHSLRHVIVSDRSPPDILNNQNYLASLNIWSVP